MNDNRLDEWVGRFIKIDEISLDLWPIEAVYDRGDRIGLSEPDDVFVVMEKFGSYYRCLSRIGFVEINSRELDLFGYTVGGNT